MIEEDSKHNNLPNYIQITRNTQLRKIILKQITFMLF